MTKIRNHIAYWLMSIGFYILPKGRYKTRLSIVLRTLTIEVAAEIAANQQHFTLDVME